MLTDAQVRSSKPSDSPRKLFDTRGLYLHVMPNGGRYWRFNYRFKGKNKTLPLGVYPDVSLAKARERHQAAREKLVEKIDPCLEKQVSGKTFEEVAREWHDHWKASRHQRHAHYVLARLEADVFPEIGDQPLEDLQASAFRDAVLKIERRGALEIAKRVLQTCGQIMRYAVAHDFATHNPVGGVKPSDILKPHKRRNALQLMALTFVRTSELIGARWIEFDIDAARWDIPAERMKMKTPHIVALSKQALAVLERLREISFDRELVFPGDLKPAKPMSNNTLLFALYRLGYRGRMTGHGFRGVASTNLHEQGWPHQHIELQLVHRERDDARSRTPRWPK
jgi:integrase